MTDTKNDSGIIERRPVVGLLTLLVIFSVLCLTVLAILSYSTAKYERALAQKSADSVTAYYAADAWCTDAANDLHAVWLEGGDLAACAKKYGGSYENGVISLSRKVDDARLLSVKLDTSNGFAVTAWNTVPLGDWSYDDSMHVWDGN